VVLVDPSADNHGVKEVHTFLHYDFTDHSNDVTHAKNIVEQLGDLATELNGCLTFSESCLTLTTALCEELDLPSVGSKSAKIVISKADTLQTLAQFPNSKAFSSKWFCLNQENDFAEAAKCVHFPAVLKPDTGSDSFGVKYVENLEQSKTEYNRLINTYGLYRLNNGFDCETMLLTDYLDGSGHKLDFVMFEGEMLHASVIDVGPPIPGQFVPTAFCIPSVLSEEKVKILVDAIHKCCLSLGLLSGVFHADMKMTSQGPKLLEINAFIGGLIRQSLIMRCYGIDMLWCNAMINCGLKPEIVETKPNCNGIVAECYPSFHRDALNDEKTQEMISTLNDDNVTVATLSKHVPSANVEFEKPCFSLVVCDSKLETAKQRVIQIFEDLHLITPSYHLPEYLKLFS